MLSRGQNKPMLSRGELKQVLDAGAGCYAGAGCCQGDLKQEEFEGLCSCSKCLPSVPCCCLASLCSTHGNRDVETLDLLRAEELDCDAE